MTLTKIEYGSIASSEIVNNNFQHLDDKISSVSQSLSANTTALSGTISSLSATVASNKEEISSKLAEFIYVKKSYKQEHDWYRLFSDGWIEQGGYCNLGSNGELIINLHIPMTDTNYSIHAGIHRSYYNGNLDIGITGACAVDENSIKISCGRNGGNIYWRVCGFANIEQQS